ncbi:XRE family transcriptional regulator [Streptomyces bobili]|uniref:XRE family transcriptional regulator n=1 Tax=Streptomyces bobili TaxID=67280 RepID=UPI0036F78549
MSSVSWEETKRKARERRIAAGLSVRTAEEKQAAMDRLAAEVRAYQLAEVRRDQALTQRDVALVMGVSAPRVSAIEHGEVDRIALQLDRLHVDVQHGESCHRVRYQGCKRLSCCPPFGGQHDLRIEQDGAHESSTRPGLGPFGRSDGVYVSSC